MADITSSFFTFFYVSTTGILQEGSHVGIFVPEGYRKGIASGIALGLARMWKKGTILSFARKHE